MQDKAPDLIMEIFSPDCSAEKMCEKFEIYEKAGIKEYWTIMPRSKRICVWQLVDGSFTKHTYYHLKPHKHCKSNSKIAKSALLAGLEIPLETIFAE